MFCKKTQQPPPKKTQPQMTVSDTMIWVRRTTYLLTGFDYTVEIRLIDADMDGRINRFMADCGPFSSRHRATLPEAVEDLYQCVLGRVNTIKDLDTP